MTGTYPQHFGTTIWAPLILAGHIALVWCGCIALGADAFPPTAHSVFAFSSVHGLSPEQVPESLSDDQVGWPAFKNAIVSMATMTANGIDVKNAAVICDTEQPSLVLDGQRELTVLTQLSARLRP